MSWFQVGIGGWIYQNCPKHERFESAWDYFGKFIHQFQSETKTLIRKLKRILIKLCVCVCVYIYMCVYIYIYTYIYIYIYTHTHTHPEWNLSCQTFVPKLALITDLFENWNNAAQVDTASHSAVFGLPQQSFTHVLLNISSTLDICSITETFLTQTF